MKDYLGVFETMRFKQGRSVYFDQHLERLLSGCKKIGIKRIPAARKIKRQIINLVNLMKFADTRLKIIIQNVAGIPEIEVIASKYKTLSRKKYQTGFKICVSSFKQNRNNSFSRIKSTKRDLYEKAYQQAKNSGFDEALIINQDGYICELSRSNIFFVINNTLFTPSISCGCLPGITRQVVFDLAKKKKLKVIKGKFRLTDLYRAKEIFITNSLVGIMPISLVGKKNISRDSLHKVTDFLIGKYKKIL